MADDEVPVVKEGELSFLESPEKIGPPKRPSLLLLKLSEKNIALISPICRLIIYFNLILLDYLTGKSMLLLINRDSDTLTLI